jgi:hypothetical protein
MSEPENVVLAREGLEAFQRGDVEAFLNFLDPEMLEVEGGMATRVHLYQDREQALATAQAG